MMDAPWLLTTFTHAGSEDIDGMNIAQSLFRRKETHLGAIQGKFMPSGV
jgi:hypothetical protein